MSLIAWVLDSFRPSQKPKECALRQRIYRNKQEKLQNQIKASVPNCLSQTEKLQNQIKASVPNSLSQTVRYSALI